MMAKHHPFIHLVAILGCVLLASAIRQKIRSAQELINLYDNVWDSTVKIDIDMVNDLDFSGIELQKPLGTRRNDEYGIAYCNIPLSLQPNISLTDASLTIGGDSLSFSLFFLIYRFIHKWEICGTSSS